MNLPVSFPALSSLSSQSPPTSPFITAPADNPPPPPPPPLPSPTNLSLSQQAGAADADSQVQTEPLHQSEVEPESLDQSPSGPWDPRAWPEGRQVLTHLVEGFVIQEGLQPFPVLAHIDTY